MATSLESITCYEAVTRDDAQFDGRFYTAVITTGIFCRPVCPAQTPRPENVRFFSTAAAAAESGFRPCLRCKPELAPDPPLWQATSPVVGRALRLIGQGFLDTAGVGELARRLNVSPRQLRRLFIAEIGAPPVAVAQTRRLLFAKKLIDETNLSMAEVAFSAGYGSVRRFNDAIRQTYGRTPSEIRKRRRRSLVDPDGTTVALKLYYRNPYNWPGVLSVLDSQAFPGVEAVVDGVYRRTISIDGIPGSIEVRPLAQERAVLVRVPAKLSRYLLSITESVKGIFDLRADPVETDAALLQDLAPVVEPRRGMRLVGGWDGYELAIRAVLDSHGRERGDRLACALVAKFGEAWPCATDADLTHLFPTPERLSDADLGSIGLTASQARAIKSISRAVADGSLDFSGAITAEAVADQLRARHGLDESSATMVVMRALGDPDLIPGDTPWDGPTIVSAGDLRSRAEAWRPRRSYAAMYLWASALEHEGNVPNIEAENLPLASD